jgi:RNA polymerase-binding transcription factor DksA
MNTHNFKRVEGRTYSVCTVCGVLKRMPAENDAALCVPKAQPIREDEPKLGSRDA